LFDEEITWLEITNVLEELKNGASTGLDGIPAEVYKAFAKDHASERLQSSQLLIAAINTLFNGFIPEEMMTSTVVSVYKKQDPSDPDNYRGISLMPVLLKITCACVAKRLSREFENHHLFTDAQAGFRWFQQCVGHTTALLEIASRWRSRIHDRERKLVQNASPVYICFVDFQKAYDRVPHEALLHKLQFYGVRGKTYNFICKLYSNSLISFESNMISGVV